MCHEGQCRPLHQCGLRGHCHNGVFRGAGGARASSRASEGLRAGRWPDWFLRGAHSWHKRKRYWPLAAAWLSSLSLYILQQPLPHCCCTPVPASSYSQSNMSLTEQDITPHQQEQPLQGPTFFVESLLPSSVFSSPAGLTTAAPTTTARWSGAVSQQGDLTKRVPWVRASSARHPHHQRRTPRNKANNAVMTPSQTTKP